MPEGFVTIKKEESDSSIDVQEQDRYPHGTTLSFNDELLEEVGLGDAKVGDLVEIRALAFVRSTHEHEDGNSGSKGVDLQLTEVKANPVKSDRVKTLYGGE